MKFNVGKIELEIYHNICADFAEYAENRLKVYRGITAFLSSISMENFLNTPSEMVYELYNNFCTKNNIPCLTRKSFAKAMTGLCGFKSVQHKRNGANIHYFEIGDIEL